MPAQSTRELIVEKADALFYESGFEATSFADIAAAVGISRGNFYHHFKTKDDILDAVIARRMERTRAMLGGWQAEGEGPRERILSFIHMLIANQSQIMDFGCPVGTLCSELAKLGHAAQGRATEIFGLFRDWLADQIRELGAVDRAETLAMHLLAWSQGVAVMATAFKDEAFIRNEVAGIGQWLASLPDLSQPT
ncbi:AcrR family transcriptional regulator [Sinorhizobium terangae]|uniref:TetR family transcriptional regulator n=1 Tax=Sinorhizobium terangae TaxID=110322 RepID=A0A6N7LIW1_SINTE|nr:TetR/AcrR family transcriptional regulator [Sinorhizobium terangae]MBB4188936.1 AcrR family transcriptional regulator [Sinorhizobium terangae]MQX17813.1 TetR family transcriptional regulator [Sinorhizobium terangae]